MFCFFFQKLKTMQAHSLWKQTTRIWKKVENMVFSQKIKTKHMAWGNKQLIYNWKKSTQ